MAIYTLQDAYYPMVYDIKCFFCGKHLAGEDCIMWAGWGNDLVLHPSCALDLMVRLMRDVWEYQNKHEVRSSIILGEGEKKP